MAQVVAHLSAIREVTSSIPPGNWAFFPFLSYLSISDTIGFGLATPVKLQTCSKLIVVTGIQTASN